MMISPQEKPFQEMTRSRVWPSSVKRGGREEVRDCEEGCWQVEVTQDPDRPWVQSGEINILSHTEHHFNLSLMI